MCAFHFFVCFWARRYITATEIRQVQSFCIIYIHTFLIIIYIHNRVYEHRKPLQPMLRTPITTGALSLTCIYIDLQKMPYLFSFMLNPASRHNFSLFSNTSLTFPPLQKTKSLTPNIPLMSYKYLCKSLARSWLCSSPWAILLLLPCMSIPGLIPLVQVLEEVCTVVLNTLNTSRVDH